ncbi:MAG: FGGY-family carbohydrate kinase, partial [Chromatiaceae bacterium]
MTDPCFVGVDLGTSGCRAVAIDGEKKMVAWARHPLPPPILSAGGGSEQSPEIWWTGVVALLRELSGRLNRHRVAALCIDGTSATLLLCAADGSPLAPALMYNDSRAAAEAALIASAAPNDSPARGASSSLAKLLYLRGRLDPPPGAVAVHQADWILGRLTGRFGISDWNNSLKLGYDPLIQRWPDWLGEMDLTPVRLPQVVAPGTPIGPVHPSASAQTGLGTETLVVSGTTDSTAAVIAAGAKAPGDAVTSLGSTLVVKVLGETPVRAPEYGVYSHRLKDIWLIGGASNSGGAVLRQLFSDEQIRRLTQELRPDETTGLDYYPLPVTGERFPVNDPGLAPRLEPRPDDDRLYFQGLLEGMARIEAAGYHRLQALGAPSPKSVVTIGGGAENSGWTHIRERMLGIPVQPAAAAEAALGTALLALDGYRA